MGEPIMWGGDDPFTHLLTVGPTRCGKTATILEPLMYQLLIQKKQGKKVGFSYIEPKGDSVIKIKEFCDVMEIPYIYIDPTNPDSHRFNVMEGDKDDVAEATVAVLQSLFGKQEAFFQTVQELSTRNVTKLLKEIRGDDLDLMDLLETLRDEKLLKKRVEELRRINPNSELLPFFDNELLGSLKDQYRKLVIGLRAQLENITGNEKLKRIITGKSDINLDKHFEEGGILLVNTSLGTLKKAGDAFGQFVIMHLQSATFRRKGTEKTRTPHFLIADEYSRYINPDVEMFLSIAASYRVAGVFATQSLGQLEVEAGKISGKAMKQAILTSCRNKIAFCGLSAEDAKEFAEEFGKDKVVMRQSTYKNRVLLPRLFPEHYRDTEMEEYRYHYTYLQDNMKRFHYLCRILKDGTPQRPFEGVGQFVPRDWKERREWEQGTDKSKRTFVTSFPKKIIDFKEKLKSKQEEKRMKFKMKKQHKQTFEPEIKPEKEINDDQPNDKDEHEESLDLEVISPKELEKQLSEEPKKTSISPVPVELEEIEMFVGEKQEEPVKKDDVPVEEELKIAEMNHHNQKGENKPKKKESKEHEEQENKVNFSKLHNKDSFF